MSLGERQPIIFGIPEVIASAIVDVVNTPGPMERSNGYVLAPEGSEMHSLFRNNFSSHSHPDIVKQEGNCIDRIYEFCKRVLNIQDPRGNIKLDRAHRVGARSEKKSRSVVAKFLYTEHKK